MPYHPKIRLTQKEVDRGDSGITIIVRPQTGLGSDGRLATGFTVMAVRIANPKILYGSPLGRTFTVKVDTKAEVSAATKEVARWVSRMGFTCKLADASRHRQHKTP